MRHAIKTSLAPVIFSHSNSRTVYGVTRNVPDDVIDSLPEKDGVIMLVALSGFVSDSEVIGENFSGSVKNNTVAELADHAVYIKERIGAKYIGIGADFDGMTEVLQDFQDV